jgi:ubiquinone/menaquinone biosynthesis C-methylase UbiE
MSSYADYSRTAASYDATRGAIGIGIILGALAERMALDDVRLLDLGCGTGNYSAALAPRLRRVEALDLNPAMIEIAKQKITAARLTERVRFHCGAATDLPFAAQQMNALCINQMLHHLPVDNEWSSYRLVFDECARVLREAGTLVINTCTREQLRRGFWYYPLAPSALDECLRLHIPQADLDTLLAESGFGAISRVVPVDAVLQGSAYFDPRGPLDPAWRDGDSFWELVDDAELDRATTCIRDLEARSELDDYMHRHDEERRLIGQTTFVIARRR